MCSVTFELEKRPQLFIKISSFVYCWDPNNRNLQTLDFFQINRDLFDSECLLIFSTVSRVTNHKKK